MSKSKNQTPRVFLVQDNPRLGFGPAEKFGTLQDPLFPGHVQVYRDPASTVQKIHQQLTSLDFNRSDYLILSGDPVLMAITTAVAADFCDGHLRLLKFDRRDKIYFEIVIEDVFHRDGK